MSQTVQISLDDLGHILIPAALRKRLGLKPGMRLVVESAKRGGVQLRVQADLPKLIDEGGILVVDGEPLEDLTNIVQRSREQRNQELMRKVGM